MKNKNEYKSVQKYLIDSPRKLRAVVALIKKMRPVDAIEKLPFASRRAAGDLSKVIKSAIANARVQGASDSELIFKEIQIGEGPRLKRGNAASRGRWHPFKHRMSHIRVVLTTKKVSQESKVSQVSQEDKKETIDVKKTVKATKVAKKGAK
jgi:large subunit ribosomal protein L22